MLPSVNKPIGAILSVNNDKIYGNFLTDANGKTVYIHTEDSANTNLNNQEGEPGNYWIPVTVRNAMLDNSFPYNSYFKGYNNLNSSLMSTIPVQTVQGQAVNQAQVTYNKWPLYYYYKDQNPGDTQGQGLLGTHFLIRPDGTPIITPQPALPYEQNEVMSYQILLTPGTPLPYGPYNYYRPYGYYRDWNALSYQQDYTNYYLWRCWVNFALQNGIDINNQQAYLTWINSGAPCLEPSTIQNSYNIWLTRPYGYDNNFWNSYNDFNRRNNNWNWGYRRNSGDYGNGHYNRGNYGGGRGGNDHGGGKGK